MTDKEWLDDLAEVPLRAVSESEHQRLFALARKGLELEVEVKELEGEIKSMAEYMFKELERLEND